MITPLSLKQNIILHFDAAGSAYACIITIFKHFTVKSYYLTLYKCNRHIQNAYPVYTPTDLVYKGKENKYRIIRQWITVDEF
jgi:hypothetical protein